MRARVDPTDFRRTLTRAVLLPLVGTMDAERAGRVLSAVSQGTVSRGARVAAIDITGVTEVDAQVACTLVQAARMPRLVGAEAVLTGIRPRVARALVGLGVDLGGVVTRKDLQSGVEYAREHLRRGRPGRRVMRTPRLKRTTTRRRRGRLLSRVPVWASAFAAGRIPPPSR